MRSFFRLASLLFLLMTSGAQAGTFIVNPAQKGAADTNPGSPMQPLCTINRAAQLVQPGDLVEIHSGVYREKITISQSGTKEQPIRFEAAPGATVVITGADPLTNWSKETESTFSIPWTYRLYQENDHNPGGAEQVFRAGVLLCKVASLNELTESTFFVDLPRKRLHLRADRNPNETLAERPIEGSTRSEVWTVTGSHVQTRGLHFRYAANRAQRAMATFRGAFNVVEDCIFSWSNSTGASFQGEDITVRRCVFENNGQQGFTANHAHRLLFDGCTVQRNNVKSYPRGWEAGGNKIVFTHNAILQNSRFLKNHGDGIWFDISNVDCTVRNCFIADNEDAGIFYEISYGLHAYDNVIVGNGLAGTKGSWGSNSGISVSSSPGCVVERNLIIGNEQGFCFREQNRTTPPIDGSKGPGVPVWNHDEMIRNNLIVNNHSAQVQGWFDIATERHWPKAMQTGQVETGKAKENDAADYQARTDGVPVGLSLEDLKITFRGNFYALKPNQPFFVWGTNWKRKQAFKDLPSLTQAIGFEDPHSRILPSLTLDVANLDFRLPEDHPAITAGVYPQGKVPDCVLGVR